VNRQHVDPVANRKPGSRPEGDRRAHVGSLILRRNFHHFVADKGVPRFGELPA
jgi:hypothetical protein